MLDYLISLMDFTIGDVEYNFITSPWSYLINWISRYQQTSTNAYASTALRDAYYDLAKLGFFYSILVLCLLALGVFFVYKIASGFTGWMRFK